MKIRIDFTLNSQFGIVEKIIFRLVLNGFREVKEIVKALPLFSDSVIANGIRNLVNHQVLTANIETSKLSLSEPLIAIIDKCVENAYEINVPVELENYIKGSGLLISGITSSLIDDERQSLKDAIQFVKKVMLFELLPGVNLDMYINIIDFILYEERGDQHE